MTEFLYGLLCGASLGLRIAWWDYTSKRELAKAWAETHRAIDDCWTLLPKEAQMRIMKAAAQGEKAL